MCSDHLQNGTLSTSVSGNEMHSVLLTMAHVVSYVIRVVLL